MLPEKQAYNGMNVRQVLFTTVASERLFKRDHCSMVKLLIERVSCEAFSVTVLSDLRHLNIFNTDHTVNTSHLLIVHGVFLLNLIITQNEVNRYLAKQRSSTPSLSGSTPDFKIK